jgi:GNAT superfamily N-acetyltransferase
MANQVIDIVMATPDAIPELAQSFAASWGTFDNNAVALVAVVDGQAVGTVTLKSDDWRPREDLSPWLGGLFVLPEHRGRGIAGRLVAALAAEARQRGSETLYTDCHAATVLLPGWQRIENTALFSLDLAGPS